MIKKISAFVLIVSLVLLVCGMAFAATRVSGSDLVHQGSIDDFTYEIEGKNVRLKSYEGSSDIVFIESSYEIDGEKYVTDLTDFQLRSRSANSVYISEGITEVEDSIFNSSSEIKKIYLPTTLKVVSTRMLGYLRPDEGEKIEVYYGGGQKEFEKKMTDESGSPEKNKYEQKGADWANKLNNMLLGGFEPEDFDFIFEATKDDFLGIAVETEDNSSSGVTEEENKKDIEAEKNSDESAVSVEDLTENVEEDKVNNESAETKAVIRLTPEKLIVAVKKQDKLIIEVVDKESLPAKPVYEWKSLDTAIATVNTKGLVKGISPGTTQIVCNVKGSDEIKAVADIEVFQPVQNLKSASKTIFLHEGETLKWEIQIIPEGLSDTKLEYSASNDNVSIDANGNITGKKKGKSKVTAIATDGSGKKLTCDVSIDPKVPIELVGGGYGIYQGDLFGIEVLNKSESKTLVDFEFELAHYDYYGNEIYRDVLSLGKQVKIKPRTRKMIKRTVYGASQAYQSEITFLKLQYSDGTIYEIQADVDEKTWNITR